MTTAVTTPPALIAVDIDGTLLSSSGTLLPGTRAEFARSRGLGATLVLASGRPVAGLRTLLRRLRLEPEGIVLVGTNGAVCVDAVTSNVLARRPLEHDLAARVVSLAAEHGLTLMLCDGDVLVVDRPEDPQILVEVHGNGLTLRAVPDLTTLTSGDVTVDKVLMTAPAERLRSFATVFAARFEGLVEFSFSAPFYFEVTAPGVDKGSALRDVAASRGVHAAECVAFGDNFNDLPMLRAAGLGVAMGNATRAVREAADRVTASNDDEGIAVVLAELFGAGSPAPPVPEPDDQERVYELDLREIGGLVHPDDR